MSQADIDDSEAEQQFAAGFHKEDFDQFGQWGQAEVERRLTAGDPPFHVRSRERTSAAVWLREKAMRG